MISTRVHFAKIHFANRGLKSVGQDYQTVSQTRQDKTIRQCHRQDKTIRQCHAKPPSFSPPGWPTTLHLSGSWAQSNTFWVIKHFPQTFFKSFFELIEFLFFFRFLTVRQAVPQSWAIHLETLLPQFFNFDASFQFLGSRRFGLSFLQLLSIQSHILAPFIVSRYRLSCISCSFSEVFASNSCSAAYSY